MSGLAGTGRLGDDLYLLAHHELTGKPYLQPRATGLGLAGAVLAELALAGLIWAEPRQIVVTSSALPPDELGRHVLGLVAGERARHPVREWLLFLARTAADDVAGRLAGSGFVVRAGRRGPWRAAHWVPVNPDWAFAPLLRARAALESTRPVPGEAVVLAGLATACGLGFRLAEYALLDVGRLQHAIDQLDPSVRELITQTQAAVDSALLSHRA